MSVFVRKDGVWVDKVTGAPMLSEAERKAEIALPYIISDIPEYTSPIDGNVITSRSQRREDMKRHNCVDARELGSPTQGRLRNKAFCEKRGLQVSDDYR